MTHPLIDKLRSARQTQVSVSGFEFTIRRPTDWEMVLAQSQKNEDVLKRFVIDWNLTELDIISGGMASPVEFDPALFFEWVADRPDIWEPLFSAIIDSYKAHDDKRQAAEKKPENGLSEAS